MSDYPEDKIARAKLVMRAVDDYTERPTGENRAAIRHLLMDLLPEATAMRLHQQIMNIPCVVPDTEAGSKHHAIWASGYKLGHRDARHAAASLSLNPHPMTNTTGNPA